MRAFLFLAIHPCLPLYLPAVYPPVYPCSNFEPKGYTPMKRADSNEYRMDSAWFGQGAQIKQRALDTALQLVA